jgi:cytoskeletal protein RodZ
MRTVGEILKEARLKKNYTVQQVSLATKIRPNFLDEIEANHYNKIAEGTVVKGLIKNYAEFLGISSKDLLAIFRRDFIEDKKGQILPRGTYEPLDNNRLAWTPKLTFFLGSGLIVLVFVIFFLVHTISYLGSPPLNIQTPKDNLTTKQSSIEIKGRTEADNAVYVDGEIVTVSPEGIFLKTVVLTSGENKIKIEAVSRRGKKTIKTITINLTE